MRWVEWISPWEAWAASLGVVGVKCSPSFEGDLVVGVEILGQSIPREAAGKHTRDNDGRVANGTNVTGAARVGEGQECSSWGQKR